MILVGHTGGVLSTAWSPGGETLATAGKDGTVRVWSARTGAEIQRLTIGRGPVNGVAWSTDGRQLATAGSDGDVLVWDPETGVSSFALRGHSGAVLSLAWSADSAHLISTGQDGRIYLWKARPDLEAQAFAQNDILYAQWLPTGDRIVIGSGSWAGTPVVLDGAANVIDGATGDTLLTFDTGTDTVFAAVPSPNGRYVVTDQGTPDLYVWDLQTGQRIATLACHPAGCGAWPAWSPDGRFIANQGFGTGIVYLFDALTGEVIRELNGFPEGTFIVTVAWSPDGRRIAASPQSSDNVVRIWDVATGVQVLRLEGNTDNVEAVAWSPTGDRLCTASGTAGIDNSIRIWNAVTGREMLRINQHEDYVLSCQWSPNGERLLSSSGDNTVRMWDASSGAELMTLHIPSVWYSFGLWSPDGKALLTFSDVTPKVQIWHAWQSTQDLIAEAHACCVLRTLTTAERLQYDLPTEP